MQKRLVTRYATRSEQDADENQRRVEAVFAELEATKAASRPGAACTTRAPGQAPLYSAG